MAGFYDEMNVVRDAVLKQIGISDAATKKFNKMVASMFGEAVPCFSIAQAKEGASKSSPELQVGKAVELRRRVEKDDKGVYYPRIEVWDQSGVVVGELEGDRSQLLIVAITIRNCIAFVKDVDPFTVYVDRVPGVKDPTIGELRDAVWASCGVGLGRLEFSSMRFKLQKTYLKKFPERSNAFGMRAEEAKPAKAKSAVKEAAPKDAEGVDELLQAIVRSYEGKVRASTLKQLEDECPEYKASKAAISRYAKSQGLSVADFLKQKEILSEVARSNSIARPAQQLIDEWYKEAGLSPSDAIANRDAGMGMLVFSGSIDSKYDIAGGSITARFYEVFRSGDFLECHNVPDESWAAFEKDSLMLTLNGNLEFRFLGDDNSLITSMIHFYLSRVERARYHDYGREDLALLLADPGLYGVPENGIQAKVVGTSGGRERLRLAVDIAIAFDEELYREKRSSLKYSVGGSEVECNFDERTFVKPIAVTQDDHGTYSAAFSHGPGLGSSNEEVKGAQNCNLADSAEARKLSEGSKSSFEQYKKVVKATVEIEGVAILVEYKPTRAINQLEKYLKEGKRVALSEKLQTDDWADLLKDQVVFFDDDPQYGVSKDLLASPKDSAKCLIDMLRVLALLTDDEMLERVVQVAPRRKDGDLAGGRLAISVDMDGIFDDGTYYNVSAKSDSPKERKAGSPGAIEIAIDRKKQPWQSKFYGGAANFLEEHADIVKRMGL